MATETKTAMQCLEREEIARRTTLSQRKVDQLIADGEIPSLKIGKRRVVLESSLAKFLTKLERAAR